MSSEFGWHQNPRLQKLQKFTMALENLLLLNSARPRKVRRGAKFKMYQAKSVNST